VCQRVTHRQYVHPDDPDAESDGDWIFTLAELKAHFEVLEGDLTGLFGGEGDCLCAVDVEAVLERSGIAWEPDTFGYVVETMPPPRRHLRLV
jgi:hypothetical protein